MTTTMNRMTGVVAFYNRQRGWGFIVPDDLTGDLFLHVSNLPRDHQYANEGDAVEFDIGPHDPRGSKPLAVNVRVIKEARTSYAVNPEVRHDDK